MTDPAEGPQAGPAPLGETGPRHVRGRAGTVVRDGAARDGALGDGAGTPGP